MCSIYLLSRTLPIMSKTTCALGFKRVSSVPPRVRISCVWSIDLLNIVKEQATDINLERLLVISLNMLRPRTVVDPGFPQEGELTTNIGLPV